MNCNLNNKDLFMQISPNDTAGKPANFMALMPFLVFIVFYLCLSLAAKDFYCVPMPVAFLVASAAALIYDRSRKLDEKVEVFAHGMGERNIMIMCLIFILAGIFAAIAKSTGAVEAAVVISRHLIPDSLFVVGIFIVSCFISLAIGTSCGTIAALTPIAAALVKTMHVMPELAIGAVIGGAMFGDNMSIISDTTIAATRTQNVNMHDKFFANLRMILPAAVVSVLIYLFIGMSNNIHAAEKLVPINWTHIVNIVPYILILIGALAGLNVIMLLFCGSVLAGTIGIAVGKVGFWGVLATSGSGALGMSETLIVAILAGGLLALIRENGGISYLMNWIEKRIAGKSGCEFGTVLLISVVNLFTANNTVAIVIAGPIARELSQKFNCDPKRIASILDTASCVVQGLLPYGAQMLIAFGIAKAAGLEISSLKLCCFAFYPVLLALALLWSILLPLLRNVFRGKK